MGYELNKILITGGFGFLGTSLTEELLKDKANLLHVVDDMSTSPVILEDYLSVIGNPKNLTYDICTIDEYFKRDNVPVYTEIFHLASPVGPAGVLKHAGNMVRDVVRDNYTLMDYCIKYKCKMLDVSTSEVYGGGVEGYCSEETSKVVPPKTTIRLEYAIAKLAAETALINTCTVTDLRAIIVRPFNISGPRQSPLGGFVLPRFIQLADAGKPITVFGKGNQIRAFTHVKDMVGGIILAAERGQRGIAYNLGSVKNKTTILDLAQRVKRILKSKSEIIFVDPKTIYGPLYEEANDKFPDATKAEMELGWIPKYSIDETISDAYNEYNRQKENGVLKDPV
jgi:nucleoside-diphosphate-sugar epimerase